MECEIIQINISLIAETFLYKSLINEKVLMKM